MKIIKTKSVSYKVYRKSIQAESQTTSHITLTQRRALRITI